jgi:signal peptidase I
MMNGTSNHAGDPGTSHRVSVSGCPETMKRSIKLTLMLRLGLFLLLLLVIGAFVRSNIGTLSVVEGPSMLPTFKPDDIVQARTLYLDTERGSVVIMADHRGDHVIKRVIGLPGETVTIYRGFVYINGRRLLEPYLPGHTYTFKSDQADEQAITWQLGNHQYFVMGDNRLESYDSRNYGPVERRQLSRIVNLPANEAKPGFGEVMLSKTGKVIKTTSPHHPDRNRVRNRSQNANDNS